MNHPILADITDAISMLNTIAGCDDNRCHDCRTYALRHRNNLQDAAAQLPETLRDAARYRGLRDALVAQDESFFERMEAACPALRDEITMPTKEEWDAALDTVLGLV